MINDRLLCMAYKHMCKLRIGMHTATYDPVVQFLLLMLLLSFMLWLLLLLLCFVLANKCYSETSRGYQ